MPLKVYDTVCVTVVCLFIANGDTSIHDCEYMHIVYGDAVCVVGTLNIFMISEKCTIMLPESSSCQQR